MAHRGSINPQRWIFTPSLRERRSSSPATLPFDLEASRAYGRLYAAVIGSGRKACGARAVDLLIAATACASDLPLFTRNPDDFVALADLIEVITV